MAAKSKDKGARFERELAKVFKEYGFDARRTAQYCGNSGDAADVVGLPFIHVEAKRQEQIRIYEWIEQAIRDAEGTGNIPAVFFRKNKCDILVTMQINDWFELYYYFLYGLGVKNGE